jgi:hypothetical protein
MSWVLDNEKGKEARDKAEAKRKRRRERNLRNLFSNKTRRFRVKKKSKHFRQYWKGVFNNLVTNTIYYSIIQDRRRWDNAK